MKLQSKRTTSTSLYMCKLCNYSTDKSANLSRHRKTMHEAVRESIVCCGLPFSSKAEYRAHNKMNHLDGHNCQICNRKFSRRALLRRHLSIHTGYKEFKCDRCTYASSHKSNLSRHMSVHRYEPTPQHRQPVKSVKRIKSESKRKISQVDSTTSGPVLNPRNTQSSHRLKTCPILRSMLDRIDQSSFSSLSPSLSVLNAEETSESKLSHSIESILSGCDEVNIKEESSSISNEPSWHESSNININVLSIDEVSSTSIPDQPSLSLSHEDETKTEDEDGNTNDKTDVGTMKNEVQVNDYKYPNIYWSTNTLFHNYSNPYNYSNNYWASYDYYATIAGGYWSSAYYRHYPFYFFPPNGLRTMMTNVGWGQDSRNLPSLHSPYAVSSTPTTSGYRTFQPRVLISNPSLAPPSTPFTSNYELSTPGLSTDSSQYSAS